MLCQKVIISYITLQTQYKTILSLFTYSVCDEKVKSMFLRTFKKQLSRKVIKIIFFFLFEMENPAGFPKFI